MTLKTTALVIVAAVLVPGGFTWWALESSEVAVIETRVEDGSMRSTHVWFAETEGELWVEAGTPDNPWFLDVQREPRILLKAGDRSRAYLAETHDQPAAREQLRARLRSKYGVRDWWIGFVFDTDESIAVKLIPTAAR